MKWIHTSDWHLGHVLFGRKRHSEFELFFDWLLEYIDSEKVDGLIVAGDIFDTLAPGNRAQELYYNFLIKLVGASVRHIVITGGNHDSPSFLEAPKELLKRLDIHVIGTNTGSIENELLLLKDKAGNPEAIVCAVPFLRDIQSSKFGESIEERENNIIKRMAEHYRTLAELAEKTLAELDRKVPVIATGHMFAAGAITFPEESAEKRSLYVGSLGKVGADIFSDVFDYVALGHIHGQQTVAQKNHIRYSGSPLPMSFDEAAQEKVIVQIKFEENKPVDIRKIPVPKISRLEKISGNRNEILERISELLEKKDGETMIEVIYTGEELIGSLQGDIVSLIENSKNVVLARTIDRRTRSKRNSETPKEEHVVSLNELNPEDVFKKLILERSILEAEHAPLELAYSEIIETVIKKDDNSEN